MSIVINIPSLNGIVMVGLAGVRIDASLSEDKKLPLYKVGDEYAEQVKWLAAEWAYDQHTDPTARRLMVNGVVAIIDFGLIRSVGQAGNYDGDIKAVTKLDSYAVTNEKKALIQNMITNDDIKKALTVIIATKVNYWVMNHHTGQRGVAGYVKEVLEYMFGTNQVTDQVVSAANSLGHFASTLYVLKQAGHANLRETIYELAATGVTFELSDKHKLKFMSMPAGTHRLAVSYEAARRLVRGVYGQFCPSVKDFANLPELRLQVMANPVIYHIDALYLTGRERADYTDTNMEAYMGRLGTFINVVYKNSTLSKSPHFQTARVENYEDYSPEYKVLLQKILRLQAANKGRIPMEQFKASEIAPPELMTDVREVFGIVRKPE